MSKARKLFVLNKIEYDDFNNTREEHRIVIAGLKDVLAKVTVKLNFLK